MSAPSSLTRFSRPGIAAFGCAALLALASPALAQDTTTTAGVPQFERGQWAAEFGISSGIGGLGVMRFRSAKSAWLVDGGVSLSSGRTDAARSAVNDMNQYSVDLRAGLRRYHPLRRSTSAFHTIGAHGGFSRASIESDGVPGAPESATQTSRSWRAGLFAELGASYFLTSSLSLGASTRVEAGYSRASSEFSIGPRESSSRHLSLSTGGTRLLGTLYF